MSLAAIGGGGHNSNLRQEGKTMKGLKDTVQQIVSDRVVITGVTEEQGIIKIPT